MLLVAGPVYGGEPKHGSRESRFTQNYLLDEYLVVVVGPVERQPTAPIRVPGLSKRSIL
jgi:hypothetical protein